MSLLVSRAVYTCHLGTRQDVQCVATCALYNLSQQWDAKKFCRLTQLSYVHTFLICNHGNHGILTVMCNSWHYYHCISKYIYCDHSWELYITEIYVVLSSDEYSWDWILMVVEVFAVVEGVDDNTVYLFCMWLSWWSVRVISSWTHGYVWY